MKETRGLLNKLVLCGVAFAMVSTLAAQTANETVAKVVRIKGGVRYKVGNNEWLPLKGGDIVKPGTIIQTAADSFVDFGIGSGSAPIARPSAGMGLSFQPNWWFLVGWLAPAGLALLSSGVSLAQSGVSLAG